MYMQYNVDLDLTMLSHARDTSMAKWYSKQVCTECQVAVQSIIPNPGEKQWVTEKTAAMSEEAID